MKLSKSLRNEDCIIGILNQQVVYARATWHHWSGKHEIHQIILEFFYGQTDKPVQGMKFGHRTLQVDP